MKLSIFTLLFILCNHLVFAQTTNIPDSNFEQELLNQGIDSGTLDGQVLTSEIENLTELYLTDKDISSLAGIEDFTDLEVLICKENELTSLVLSSNINLKVLDCKHNDLNNLDVTQNTGLEGIDCSFNDLPSLNLLNNTALIRLDCAGNQMTDLDLSQNITLEDLDINFSDIEEIDLSNNIALSRLNISNTPLTEIDVTHNIALRYFKATFLDLQEIDVTQNLALINLWVRGTYLTGIDVTKNLNLIVLRLTDSELDSLDLSQNIELRELSLSENNLSELDVSNNTGLEGLSCYKNNIAELDLSENIKLTDLYCMENNMNCLNLKNGNNIELEGFNATENPMLTCIQVDDSFYSAQNWLSIDPTTTYSDSCDIQCTEEIVAIENITDLSRFQCFPNPTNGNINIIAHQNYQILRIKVYNISGKELMSKSYKNTQEINFELSATAGIYFVAIQAGGNVFERFKIVKN